MWWKSKPLQLTYEGVLIKKLEKVNLKRAADEEWDESEGRVLKKGKIEVIETVELVKKDNRLQARGKRISSRRRKKGRGIEINFDSALVKVPVLQVANCDLNAEGLGGQPLKTIKSP